MRWHEVTWYSKLGAGILLFGVLPTLSFCIGVQYEQVRVLVEGPVVLEPLVLPIRTDAAETEVPLSVEDEVVPIDKPADPPVTQIVTGTVVGRVMVGPTCPVAQYPADPDCLDKPYAAVLEAVDASGVVIKKFTAQSDGTFKVSLPVGRYALRNDIRTMLPRCMSTEDFMVTANGSVEVAVACDSGIR